MTKLRKSLENTDRKYDLFEDSAAIDKELLTNHLYPPLPIAGDLVVWGFSILREAETAGVEELNVIEVEGSPADFLVIALKLENRRDNYSWTELAKIAPFIRQHDCSSRIGEIEGLIQTTGSFLKRVELFEDLEAGPEALVISSYIDLKTAGKLRNFSEAACSLLLDKTAHLSSSDRKSLVTAINESGRRDNLDQPAMTRFVEQVVASGDPPAAARARRFPVLTEMHEVVYSFRTKHLKGTGVQISPPPAFEGNWYQVSFKCRSKEELAKRVRTLETITDKTDELFNLLF